MPRSASTSSTVGLMPPTGFSPTERTNSLSPTIHEVIAEASWERPALRSQTYRTSLRAHGSVAPAAAACSSSFSETTRSTMTGRKVSTFALAVRSAMDSSTRASMCSAVCSEP